MAAPVRHRAPLFFSDQQVLFYVRCARPVLWATSPGSIEATPAGGGPSPCSRLITSSPVISGRPPPRPGNSAVPEMETDTGDHRPNPSNERTDERSPDDLDQEDRARRGRLLPDHLHLDPHPQAPIRRKP